jgi:hypothetical protein
MKASLVWKLLMVQEKLSPSHSRKNMVQEQLGLWILCNCLSVYAVRASPALAP